MSLVPPFIAPALFDDADAGEAAAERLVAGGWERSRTVYMVFATDPSTVPADPAPG